MIYTCTPFLPNKMYGAAIKEFVRRLPKDGWILILDHDILLVQHRWYDICKKAVENSYHNHVGLFTCVTNKIGCSVQKAGKYLVTGSDTKSEDMDDHYTIAENLYNVYGNSALIHTNPKVKFSGLFMLTRLDILNQFLDFPDNKFIGFDNWYFDRVREAGYNTAILPGLYVYHSYRRLWKNDK